MGTNINHMINIYGPSIFLGDAEKKERKVKDTILSSSCLQICMYWSEIWFYQIQRKNSPTGSQNQNQEKLSGMILLFV